VVVDWKIRIVTKIKPPGYYVCALSDILMLVATTMFVFNVDILYVALVICVSALLSRGAYALLDSRFGDIAKDVALERLKDGDE